MKKLNIKSLSIGFIVGVTLMVSSSSFASGALEKIDGYLNKNLSITLDGKALILKDVPITYNSSTYLPLREVATILGKYVNWNSKTATIELSNNIKGGGINTMTNLYNSKDVLKALYDKYYNSDEMTLSFIRIRIAANGDQFAKYNNIEYAINSENSYYDKENDEKYFTDLFYLQFLPQEILVNLKKYSLNNGTITPLN